MAAAAGADRSGGRGAVGGSGAAGASRPLGDVGLTNDALTLSARLPELLVDARRVSQTVAHGIHGRRRAGSGETFWQFRNYEQTDAATMIDWRRSASSDKYFVREREWEAAHTLWLWPDTSASMNYVSHLSRVTKRDRAVVLALALADLLSRGGERIGLLGRPPARMTRRAAERFAQDLASSHVERGQGAQGTDSEKQAGDPDSLPPQATVSSFSECILISDFLEPVDATRARVQLLAGQRLRGHIVQVLDPAEETLPFEGRVEFLALEGGDRLVADNVQGLRTAYQKRIAERRDALADLARSLEWSFLVHHTDRPAEEPLLALFARLSGRAEAMTTSPAGGR